MNDLSPNGLWQSVLRDMKEIVTDAQFNTWFMPLRPGPVTERAAVIRAPNEYIRQWVSREYFEPLRRSMEKATGARLKLSFEIDQSLTPHSEGATLKGISGEALLNPEYTFENFVEGECNRLAVSAARRAVDSTDNTNNPLFIYGGHGQGKTHLLQAICHELMRRGKAGVILYAMAEEFTNEYMAAVRTRRLDGFRHICRNVDTLVIDDVHFFERTSRCQEEFFHTFNTLFNDRRRIILSSLKPPENMKKMEQRLVSRFKSGLSANLDFPDFRTRLSLIKLRAKQCEREIAPEIAEYIASMPVISIRELEGMALRLIGFCSLSGREMDMQLAKSLLESRPFGAGNVDEDTIMRRVEDFYGVTRQELLSKTRARSIAFPRQICMFLMRMLTDLSLDEIGRTLGGRDHSTVMYAVEKITGLEKKEAEISRDITRLRLEITGFSDVSDPSEYYEQIAE